LKFSICNETYVDWPFARVCDDVAASGFDGIEIAPFTLAEDPSSLDEAAAAEVGVVAQRAGLTVVGLHWLLLAPPGLHLTSPDEEVRARTVSFLEKMSRLCAAMGGHVMVLGSPQQRRISQGQSYEDAFRHAGDACRKVAETAGPLGVTLALEPLAPSIANFLSSAAETARLIEAVDHPACALHLDVSAMSSEASSIEDVILAHGEGLAHFHANDPNQGGPGTGEVDYVPIVSALRRVKYDRWVSVEIFDHTCDGPTIARQSMAYLKQVFAGGDA